MDTQRRQFLATTATLGLASLAPGLPRAGAAEEKKEKPEEDVGALADLMREHGVLNRVLLIYEEGLRRLRAKEKVTPDVFHKTATLVRKFVEDYHEKLEENFIFPEFEKRKKLVDLVKVLRRQHQAGRAVTDVKWTSAGRNQELSGRLQYSVFGALRVILSRALLPETHLG
jgi:hypothetical protein